MLALIGSGHPVNGCASQPGIDMRSVDALERAGLIYWQHATATDPGRYAITSEIES